MYENNTLLSLTEVNILEVFLDLQRHYFSELTKCTGMSKPRTLRILRKLVAQNILEVHMEAHVKYYSLKKSSSVCTVLAMIEYNRSSIFFHKNKTIKRALDLFQEKQDDSFVMLLFGSRVKGYSIQHSDVDLLFIKERVSKQDIKKGEQVSDFIHGRTGLQVSPYYMSVEEFTKKNALAKEVIDQHIILHGAEFFYRMVFS